MIQNLDQDRRIVMTLDAGGTNFVFSALQGNREIVEPITLASRAQESLPLCLDAIVEGFTRVRQVLPEPPVAISFAFPGPADYPSGVIGDLGNLPVFRGGVALGPMLEDRFGIPTFINNDGDLFAYGEAISGLLPYVNEKLRAAGSPKQYKNLFGVTLGTGFGGGIVRDGGLFLGDNAAAGEIWLMRGKVSPAVVEEDASIRAVQRVYLKHSSVKHAAVPSPKEIYDYALGVDGGDQQAALRAFDALGEAVGDALANAVTLIDGLVVIGGGLSAAAGLFLPRAVAEINGTIENLSGRQIPRTEIKAFNLEDDASIEAFLRGDARQVAVPGSQRSVVYDPLKRIGVGLTRLGTSKAVALGAYAYALHVIGDGR